MTRLPGSTGFRSRLSRPSHRMNRPSSTAANVRIAVNDHLGSTMKAAVEAVRALSPARIIVAVPVGSPDTCREFAAIADEIVCAREPEHFAAVGQWYDDFRQTTDEEVRELLQLAASEPAGKPR